MDPKFWDAIRVAVESLAANPNQTKLDMQLDDVTVLVYKAGTVIRVDFKGLI